MAKLLGANSTLAKPVDPDQLLAAIRSLLGERPARSSVLVSQEGWPKNLPDFDLDTARFWPISNGCIGPAVIYGFRPEQGVVPQAGVGYRESMPVPDWARVWR